MARRKDLNYHTISLPEYHERKLQLLVNRTGITVSGLIQRLIESANLFQKDEDDLRRAERELKERQEKQEREMNAMDSEEPD